MKKKLIIVFAVIAAVLLLIPVRKVYEDGGTQTYTCVWSDAPLAKDGSAILLPPQEGA